MSDSPNISQQKTFIIENADILDRQTKISELSLVMMEIGNSVIMQTGGKKEVDIDLDAIADTNEEVLFHIYKIIQMRRNILSQPAGSYYMKHITNI